MRLFKDTLWYELFVGRNANWEKFNEHFYQNGPSGERFICNIFNSPTTSSDIFITIIDGVVTSISPIKYVESPYQSFGRPNGKNKSFSATEIKQAVAVLNECLSNHNDDLEPLLNKVKESEPEYKGYKYVKSTKTYLVFNGPNDDVVKLKNDIILKAIEATYIDENKLKDEDVISTFMACISDDPYEPLFAVMTLFDR